MKEYLQNEGVCFGVDCLGSYAEVKKLTQGSIQACEELLQVVGRRVAAEEAHATSLLGISEMPLTYTAGSLQDCMYQLQSDTRHKADQHQILADSLVNEVVQPITMLKDQMSKKEKSLFSQYTNMNSELKRLEDAFKKLSTKYEKSFQACVANAELCAKHGISIHDYDHVVAESAKAEPVNKTPLTPLSNLSSWNSLASLTSSSNLMATKEKGKDLLNWVVSSASGTPVASTHVSIPAAAVDKKELCLTMKKLMGKLEVARTSARKSWLDFVVVSQRYAIKTQILLTKLQGMQESFILILQDHLRKIVVIESSFLANQQYDIQMLFKVMEDIDARDDIRQFILQNAATPLDLYESDDEDEDETNHITREMSLSHEENEEEHDVEVFIDTGGKPSSAKKGKLGMSNKVNSWSDSPWVSDIFTSFFSQPDTKLSHIRDLPCPPCQTRITFSQLMDRQATKKSPTDQPMQYLSVDRVRKICKVSLVSRHIEKHNSLVSNAGSLSELVIPSDHKKRNTTDRESSHQPVANTDGLLANDMLHHPLKEPGTTDCPLSHQLIEQQESKAGVGDNLIKQEEELMMYSPAEESLERMVRLQSRMRTCWLDLIEEFKSVDGGKESQHIIRVKENANDTTESRIEEEKGGSSLSSSGTAEDSSDPLLNNESNDQSRKLTTVESEFSTSNMFSRTLKDAENDKEENVDSVKCREIMNSFGLLDAVSIDVQDDHWNESAHEPHLPSSNISPQSVQDLNVSTPVSRNRFDDLSMPFLSTTKSDVSDVSVDNTLSKSMSHSNIVSPLVEQSNFSRELFGKASPESLDFLSS